jgi:hypothetical protein
MPRHERDKSSKWIIQHHGDSLVRLAGAPGIRRWKALQAEIVQPRRLPDGLLEVHFAGQKEPDHILVEIATFPEKRALRQALDDLTLAYHHLGRLPDLLMVVLARKGSFQIPGAHELSGRLGWSRIAAGWRVIELWTLSADALFAANDVGLIPWVPLTHSDAPTEDLFRRCREVIERQAPEAEQVNLKAVSQVLASLRYTDPELLAILGGDKGMSEFPLIQKFIAETMHKDIVRVLKARFGDIPEAVAARLRRIRKEERLDALLDYAAVCTDLQAFQRRLQS